MINIKNQGLIVIKIKYKKKKRNVLKPKERQIKQRSMKLILKLKFKI
jgi:hypothetical protein